MLKPPRFDRDAGFTLIELAVAMVLFGIVVAVAVGPYTRYHRSQQHSGITRRVVAALRQAQVASVSENSVYRVDFDPDSVKIYRRDPGTSVYSLSKTVSETESTIAISPEVFTLPDGSTSSSCYFYPRGTASESGGGIVISRSDSPKEYKIKVEGLTARVSYA